MNVHIRPEKIADIQAIADVTVAAFLNACHSGHNEQFIVGTLRQAGVLTVSLVAELEGIVVGHVAVSPVSVSDQSTGWFGLGPISVSPQHQGKGIGTSLVQTALLQLKQKGAAGCVLLGDPAYYRRFGFKPEKGMVLPGVPQEYFQALSFAESLPRGALMYHAAFGAIGQQPVSNSLDSSQGNTNDRLKNKT